MNFYKHHIGDYDQATRHLTFVEDAAYSRLLRKYYAEESPLPKDLKKIQKLIGARTKEEKAAVQEVLEEFFELREDGWHQSRCDEELEAAQAKALKNREIGKLGGRPRKTETHAEPTDNPNGFDLITQTVYENNPIQTPDSNNQTPDLKPEPSLVASTVGGAAESENERSTGQRHIQIAVLLRAKGVKPFSFAHPLAVEWGANPKVTDDILTAVLEQARDYKPTGDISPNYLKPIIEQMLNPPDPKPAKEPVDQWWLTNAGIDRKAKELGMFARGTETYNDFKDRIFAEIRKRNGGKAA